MDRILVIDDDAAMRSVLSECLEEFEYEVIAVGDGKTGIKIAETYCPDLVICDIHMPEMDGFSVLDHLQKQENMVDVPFIFLTGSANYNTMRQGMVLGADDFLPKPVSVVELLQVVQSRLDKVKRRKALITKAIDELRLNITAALPHELRTAIMIMEGYADLMLEDADKIDPMQQEMVEAIRENAVRLRHMSEKYLWYLKSYLPDRVNRDSVTLHPDQIIEHIAFEVAQQFDRIADLNLSLEAKELNIHTEYFEKIIKEIIENAFKFSTVNTPISVHAQVERNQFIIKITDSGHGMTVQQIKQIGGFMQFDRDQYEQQGTGLGLIISKRLIDLSEGLLSIVSEAGQTTVVIHLKIQH